MKWASTVWIWPTVALVLRDEYAVRIDEDDYPKLTTVGLISQYIQNKLSMAA